MKYIYIYKNKNGTFTISDDISGQTITYYYYGLRDAITKHRKNTNTVGRHFTKIYTEWGA